MTRKKQIFYIPFIENVVTEATTATTKEEEEEERESKSETERRPLHIVY